MFKIVLEIQETMEVKEEEMETMFKIQRLQEDIYKMSMEI